MTNVYAIDTQERPVSDSVERRLFDRIVLVMREEAEAKAEAKEAISDLKKEAKGQQLSDLRIKALIARARRELEPEAARLKRVALAEELEHLEAALGVFRNTPLAQHAIQRAARTHVGAMAD